MEQNLKSFLKSLNIDEFEIENLINICPGLEIVDFDSAKKCVDLVVGFGFPKDEIDELILINPNFLMNNPKTLKEKLEKMGDDIEEKLRKDCFLI